MVWDFVKRKKVKFKKICQIFGFYREYAHINYLSPSGIWKYPREFEKKSLGLGLRPRPREFFPNSLGYFQIPSGLREFMGIFPLKNRISSTYLLGGGVQNLGGELFRGFHWNICTPSSYKYYEIFVRGGYKIRGVQIFRDTGSKI